VPRAPRRRRRRRRAATRRAGRHVGCAGEVVDDPALVVPDVATTANSAGSVGGVEPVRPRLQRGPGIRPPSSAGTVTTSASIARAACTDRRVRARRRTMRPRVRSWAPSARGATPAGGDECAQVAGGPAADEHAAGSVREAGEVGDPAQRLVLGVDGAGALEPRSGVDARRTDHEVEQDRRLGRGRRHERQEAGVVDRDARRREHVARTPAAPRVRRCRRA
jgi:hypothetical protein